MPSPAPAAPAESATPLIDDLPLFLRFTPAPGKARRDGWEPRLQFRFVLALARGASVQEAARSLGRSRQSAYALRERAGTKGEGADEGAEQGPAAHDAPQGFAAAWDAAAEFAREARGAAAGMPGAMRPAIETLLVPRFYRGRLIGYVQRDNLTGLMARLRQLDRLADRIEAQKERDAKRALSERAAAGERGQR
jgi:hypothetical protein